MNRFLNIALSFLFVLSVKFSSAWCGDSVQVILEKNCCSCEPNYGTINYFDSTGRIIDLVYINNYNGNWENNYSYSYTYWNDSLLYERVVSHWENNAWKLLSLQRTTFNNHGLILTQIDSNSTSTSRIFFVRDSSDNITDHYSQKWNGSQWINIQRTVTIFDSQSRFLQVLQQVGDSLIWVDQYRRTYQYDAFGNQSFYEFHKWNGTQWLNQYKSETWFIAADVDTLKIIQNGDSLNWLNLSLHRTVFDTLNNKTYELYQRGNGLLWINQQQNLYNYHDTLIDSSCIQLWDTTIGWKNYTRQLFFRDSVDRISEQVSQKWEDTAWVNEYRLLVFYSANGRVDHASGYYWEFNTWDFDCNYTPRYNSSGVLVELWNDCWFVGCTSSSNSYEYDTDGILIHRILSYTSCGGGTDVTYYDYYYNLASGDSSICNPGAGTISVNDCPGYSYLWNNGETTPSITVTQSGTYTVVITDSALHHIYTAPFIVYDDASGSVNHISASGDTILCLGQSITLSADSVFEHYLWLPTNDSTSSIVVSASGTYQLISSGDSGCTVMSNTIQIQVVDSVHATVSIIGSSILCEGESVSLITDTFPNIRWNNGDSAIMISVSNSGEYYATISDSNGCLDTTNSIYITVNQLPVISLGNDTTICNSHLILLDAGIGFVNYLWQDNSSFQTLLANTDSTGIDTVLYSVSVVDNNGCTNSDIKVVIFDVCAEVTSLIINEDINIYPNPTNSSFIIGVNFDSNKFSLQIFNSIGEIVFSEDYSGSFEYIINQNFSPGFYIVALKYENKLIMKKLIIDE